MQEKLCKVCRNPIHPLRVKVLPYTDVCTEHSTEKAKRGRNVSYGQGDHTYSELEILDEDTYKSVTEMELSRYSNKKVVINLSQDDEDAYLSDDIQDNGSDEEE